MQQQLSSVQQTKISFSSIDVLSSSIIHHSSIFTKKYDFFQTNSQIFRGPNLIKLSISILGQIISHLHRSNRTCEIGWGKTYIEAYLFTIFTSYLGIE